MNFKARLHNHECLLGTMLTLDSPDVAELLASVGFDWLFVDGEHGPFDNQGIKAICQAVNDRAACLIRIPALDEEAIKKALDVGAIGIIAPQINTANEAEAVVRHCHYPPLGTRGIGVARAHRYGTDFAGYLERARDETVVVIQAETKQAVENIESIVEVEGVDCVLIGPNDLSSSYGKMGQFEDPEIVNAIQHVATVCQTAQIPLGIFGIDERAVRPYFSQGYDLVVAGIDTMMLGKTAGKMLKQMRIDSSK